MAMERSTVVGVFHNRDDAERAVDELHRIGFHDDQIGYIWRDGDRTTTTTDVDAGGHAGEGAVGGILAGAGIGGLVAAAAALLIPGFGPVVAGGILATVLGGAAIGAAAGGILGALVGMGVPEEEARYYESEVNEGRVLVTVKADGRYAEARDALRRLGAYDIEDRGTAGIDRGTTVGLGAATTTVPPTPITPPTPVTSDVRTTERDHDTMHLREERIQPRVEAVQTGEVTIGKEVVTERREMDVPVRREEVHVERRPVEGRPATGDINEHEEIRVPVREERVTVEKQPVVYEEVGIGTREVRDTEHVAADVRREEARIEREGDVAVHGWSDVSTTWRQRWQAQHGTSGGRWEDYEPGYRYGYEMASDPQYQNRQWSDVEPELRRNWGTWGQRHGYHYGDSDWDRFQGGIRESWDEARGLRRAA